MDPSGWAIHITNDNCPDYTWGFPEEQTRRNMADIVAAHLDEMTRTDHEAPESQSRYNMAITLEALCFLERCPDRREELVRRIREGRLFISPYLCNTLWGLQSVEGVLRAFYPARRFEREWGIRIEHAEHIELPSLPWGMAPLLEGCGLRWLSLPFYDYDSTFTGLTNPPLFVLEGPDGSRVRIIMDAWASLQAGYVQGGKLLREPEAILSEWLPHYNQLGRHYPLDAILASGTHGDLMPDSGRQASSVSDSIARYNASPGPHPVLVNSTLPQFCRRVDEAEREQPFLSVIRGCFGHSWELWPVSLAKHAADMRENEREFLSVEALIAVASQASPGIAKATRADRERAEWCWAMLADHAWNGTEDENRRHNADLRQGWNEELRGISDRLLREASGAAGVTPREGGVVVFNGLSFPRADLVQVEAPPEPTQVVGESGPIESQIVAEDGRAVLCFVSPEVQAYGISSVELRAAHGASPETLLEAAPSRLDCPYYSLTVDPETGGISSLVHKATGAELVADGSRTLAQTIYFDGEEHTLTEGAAEVADLGSVLARLRLSGAIEGTRVTSFVTLYATLDRVDLDIRVEKPVTTTEQRLCHTFPVLRDGDRLRVETPGAVIVPRPQPEGDLLHGADARRLAVQGCVDICRREGGGMRIAPLDAFALRLDLGEPCFEALGNDQNHREVTRDQHGFTSFRFRYSLCGYAGGYDQAAAIAWARSAAVSLVPIPGAAAAAAARGPVSIDPSRAVATCLKPADDPSAGGIILRLWETAGRADPVPVGVRGFTRAIQTDLLERDLREIDVTGDEISLDVRPLGFASVRLLP